MYAQDYSFKNLTAADGLPSMTVFEIDQDSKGNIWFGTEGGICKYDGYSMQIFESPQMNDHSILTIEIDKYDNVWFNNLSEQLFCIKQNTSIPQLIKDEADTPVKSFVIKEDTLFTTNQNHLLIRKIQNDDELIELKKYELNFDYPLLSIESNRVIFIYGSNKTKFFNEIINTKLILRSKLKYYDYNHLKFVNLNHAAQSYLVLEYSKKIKYYRNKVLVDSLILENETINNCQIVSDKILLSTNYCVRHISFENDKIILSKPFFANTIFNDHFEDIEGNLWHATNTKGVYMVSNKGSKIYNTLNSSLSDNFISCLEYTPQSNKLLVGENDGNFATLDLNSFELLNTETNIDANIKSIKSDGLNSWLASNIGLYKMKFDAPETLNKILLGTVKDVAIGDGNTCYYSTPVGTRFLDPNKEFLKISLERSYAINNMHKEYLYWGDIEGLYFINKESDTHGKPQQLTTGNISDIIVDDEFVFASTFADGLFVFKNNQFIKHYTTEDGLVSNLINDISKSGHFIANATRKGISILNTQNSEIKNLNRQEELGDEEIICVEMIDSLLFVGTAEGLAVLNLNYTGKTSLPLISLDKVFISGVETELKNEYDLSHLQNQIKIDFHAISFKSNKDILYKYKIEEIDSEWYETKSTSISFSSLSPNNYTILIKAEDAFGNESEKNIRIKLNIKKPFWSTLSFRIIAIATGLMVFRFFIIRQNNIDKRRTQRKIALEKKIDSLQMTALQSQMNPHFISNSLYSIQRMIRENKEWEAMDYTSKFAELVRTSMKQTTLERITLNQEIEFLKLFMHIESQRFEKPIKYNIALDLKSDELLTYIKIPPLLIQPIIENSFKHGNLHKLEEGKVTVYFSIADSFLEVTVRDNGLGFRNGKRSKFKSNKKSTGIQVVKNRLKLNAKLLDADPDLERFFKRNVLKDDQIIGTEIIMRIDYTTQREQTNEKD